MTCENSVGGGCSSCMTSLLQPALTPGSGRDCTVDEASGAAGNDHGYDSRGLKSRRCSQLVLLTVMAFVLPVVTSVVTVQFIESRVGSAVAAIAGLAAAGVTVAASSGTVRRFACGSAVHGADR